jgi:hydrogenase-4 component B
MLALAAACVLLGLGPTLVVPALGRVAGPVVGAAAPTAWGGVATLSVSESFARLSTLGIAGALIIGIAVPFVALARVGVSGRRRLAETWGCGRMLQTARMEYTATAFADPFKRVFRFFYRPVKRLELDVHPESRFFVHRIAYANPARSIFEEWLYQPVLSALGAIIPRVQRLQSGSTTAYLTYIFVVLLVLLALR